LDIMVEDKARILLDTLRKLGVGEWHSRSTIAGAMGKPRLNVSESTMLDVLAMQGAIERRLAGTDRPNFNRYEYRIME
jgi:hypothetical protein